MRSPPMTLLVGSSHLGHTHPSISTAIRAVSYPIDSTTSYTVDSAGASASLPLTVNLRTFSELMPEACVSLD